MLRKKKLWPILSVLVIISLVIGVLPIRSFSQTASAASALLLQDDFQDGDSAGWTLNNSSYWSIATDPTSSSNKTLKYGASSYSSSTEGIASAGDATWQDYSYEADVMFLEAGTYPGIVGRFVDNNNYYMLQMTKQGDNKIILSKKVAGTSTNLMTYSFTNAVNTWYKLRMVFQGTSIKCYLNGTLIMSANDSSLTAGKIGFRGNWGKMAVDNVLVKGIPDPLPTAPVLTVGAPGKTSIPLSWNNVDDGATYLISRSTSADGVYTNVYSGSGLSYTDTGLTTGTTYYYKGAADISGFSSADSTPISITTTALPDDQAVAEDIAELSLPSEVTGHLTLTKTGTNLSTIRWESSNEAYLQSNGTVIRPASDKADVSVTLTATVTKGAVSQTREFSVKILKQDLYTAYLMEFKKDTTQAVYYALSRDGKTWTVPNSAAVQQSILDKKLGTAVPTPGVVKDLSSDTWYKYEYTAGSWSTSTTTDLSGSWTAATYAVPAGAISANFKMLTEEEWGTLVNSLSTISNTTVINLTTRAGVAPRLPEIVKVNYSNGLYATFPVVWDALDASSYAAAGSAFTANATVTSDGVTRLQAAVSVVGDNVYSDKIRNGEFWYDTDGGLIQAHGGSMIKVGDTYYWFGEDKAHNSSSLMGISIYASKDLKSWEYRKTILTPLSNPQLAYSKIERPKVLYNAKTGKYVLWGHWETANSYSPSNIMVAVSDTVDGDYTFLYHTRPAGVSSRDFTLFQDDDGSAYLISASDNGTDTTFFRLTDDYLGVAKNMYTIFENVKREAPAMVKQNGIYYLLTSGQSGWYPNQGKYATTTNLQDANSWSELKLFGDPSSFYTQPAFIFTINGTKGTIPIYVGDRWNPTDLRNSQYIWLPLKLDKGTVGMDYTREWGLDSVTGEIAQTKELLVSQGRPVTASGAASGYAASAANDGNYTSYFDWNSTSFPAYWQVDLTRSYDLSRIDLSWKEANGSEVYYTYKVSGSNDNVNFIDLVDQSTNRTPSFNSHALSGNYRYVKVTILGEYGHTNNANKPVTWYRGLHEVKVFTSDMKLDTPTSLLATPVQVLPSKNANTVQVKWDTMYNASSYVLYRSDSENGTYNVVYEGRAAAYEDRDLAVNKTFYYKVKAIHSMGESDMSLPASAATFAIPDGISKYDNTQKWSAWTDSVGNATYMPLMIDGKYLYRNGLYYNYQYVSDNGFKQIDLYTSPDGKTWTFDKTVLNRDDNPELAACKFESMNITYNEKTDKLVFWLHYENNIDYSLGRAAVMSGDIGGDLTFHGSVRPAGNDSRDMTFFKDDDGKGYIISAGNSNNDMFIYSLSDDYLTVDSVVAKVFAGKHREAPSMIKKDGYYYLFTSEAAGWYPSKGMYASAQNLAGPWSDLRTGGNNNTFSAQSGGVMTIAGTEKTSYIMAANRWSQSFVVNDGKQSSQRWLPITLKNGYASYDFSETISVDFNSGVTVSTQNGYLLSQGKPATAGTENAMNPAGNANDGDYKTSWIASSSTWPDWWMVDLGDTYNLKNIQISWYLMNGSEGYHQYKIETSLDGVNFTTMLDRTDNTTYGFTSDKLSGKARYVRVNLAGAVIRNNPTNNWYTPQLAEVKVFGQPLDHTAPVTTVNVTPSVPDGKNGWYVHPVTVSFTADDDLSGVAKTVYSLDNGNTWLAATGAVMVNQNSLNTLLYRSEDLEGNVEAAKTISFKVDTKAPAITVTGIVYNSISDAGDLSPVITVNDDGSGADNSKTQATLDSNAYKLGDIIPLYKLPLGSHIFIVHASDLAGNETDSTVTFQTFASVDGLKQLVKRFATNKEIINAGITKSLQDNLEQNDLQDFIQLVQAQKGKYITNEAADYLLRDAKALLP